MLNLYSLPTSDLQNLRSTLTREWRGISFDHLDQVQQELMRRAANTCRGIRLELERREQVKEVRA